MNTSLFKCQYKLFKGPNIHFQYAVSPNSLLGTNSSLYIFKSAKHSLTTLFFHLKNNLTLHSTFSNKQKCAKNLKMQLLVPNNLQENSSFFHLLQSELLINLLVSNFHYFFNMTQAQLDLRAPLDSHNN